MNRLISVSSKSISVYIPQVTNRFCVFFATAKPKTDASKAKSKKASKSESEMDQKQLKSLLIHYYKMRTYEPPKLTQIWLQERWIMILVDLRVEKQFGSPSIAEK